MSPFGVGGANPLLQRPPPYPSSPFGVGALGAGYGPAALTPIAGSYPSMGQQQFGGAYPGVGYQPPAVANSPYQPIAAQNPYYPNNAFNQPMVGSPSYPTNNYNQAASIPPTNYPVNSYNPSQYYPSNSYQPSIPSLNYPTNGYPSSLGSYPSNNNYNPILSNYPLNQGLNQGTLNNYGPYRPAAVTSDQNSYRPSNQIPDPFSIQTQYPIAGSNYNSPGTQYQQQPTVSQPNPYRPVVIENPNYASQQNTYPSSSQNAYNPSSSGSLYNSQQSYRPVIQASIQEIPNDVPIYYPTKKPNYHSGSSSVFFPKD